MTQKDKILYIMLNNPHKEWWIASDFQKGDWFIGYEATARISELMDKYPTLIQTTKVGRFRAIKINWEDKQGVKEQKERLEILLNANE